jgi:hypothetical protein
MKSDRKTTMTLCVAVSALACSGVHDQQVVSLESLHLERSVCFGPCPAYTLALDVDGQIRFKGDHNVEVESAERAVLPGEVDSIVAALNQVEFTHLQDRYETAEDGCDDVATDSQTVILRAAFDGVSKSVRQYHGCWTRAPSPPPVPIVPPEPPFRGSPGPVPVPVLGCPFPIALIRLQNRIDTILGTEAWVGKTPYEYEHCSNEWAR